MYNSYNDPKEGKLFKFCRVCSILCPILLYLIGFMLYAVFSEPNVSDAEMLFGLLFLVPGLLLLMAVVQTIAVIGLASAIYTFVKDRDGILSRVIFIIYMVAIVVVLVGFVILLVFGKLNEAGVTVVP